jgi:hypothetical protein
MPISPRLLTLWVATVVASSLVVSGCGTDPDAGAEAAPRGGFVRVVNLSDVAVTPTLGDASPSERLAPGSAMNFIPVRPRPLEISLVPERGAPFTAEVPVEAGTIYSVYVLPGGQYRVVPGEIRKASETSAAIRIVNLLEATAEVRVQAGATAAGATLAGGDASDVKEITPGAFSANVTVAGSPLPELSESAEAGQAFTLVIYTANGEPKATLILNNPTMRFELGGASPA